MTKEEILIEKYKAKIMNWEDAFKHNPQFVQSAHEAMKEYALQEMICLIGNMQHRPIQCYSVKPKGQDKEFFLGRTFCEDLIIALKKQYK